MNPPPPDYFYGDEGLGIPQAYGFYYQNVSKQTLEIEGSVVPSGHFWARKDVDQFLTDQEASSRGYATQVLIDKGYIVSRAYVPTFTAGVHIVNESGYVFRLDAVLMDTPLEMLPYDIEFGSPGSGCTVAILTDPSGTITSVKVLTPGSGYATGVTTTVYSKTGSGAVLKSRVKNGQIFKVDVIAGGSGYGSFEEKDLSKYFAVTLSATRLGGLPVGATQMVYPNFAIPYPYGLILGWPTDPDMGWGGTHFDPYAGPQDLTCAQTTWDVGQQDLNFQIVPLPRHLPVATPVFFDVTHPLRFTPGPTDPGNVIRVSVSDDGRVTFTRETA